MTMIRDDVLEAVAARCGMAALGLYAYLARRVGADGRWTETMGSIAAHFGQSERHAREAARTLERAGFIVRRAALGPRGMTLAVAWELPHHPRTDRAEPTPEPTYNMAAECRGEVPPCPFAQNAAVEDEKPRTDRAEPTPEPTPELSRAPVQGVSSYGVVKKHGLTSVDPADPVVEQLNKPRTEKQRASDALFARRTALYDAYCRGVGVAVGSADAERRKPIAFRELKAVERDETLTPELLERLSRYARSCYAWRAGKQTPTLGETLSAWAEWEQAGQPEQAPPRGGSSRAAPPSPPPMVQRGAVPADGGLAAFWARSGRR